MEQQFVYGEAPALTAGETPEWVVSPPVLPKTQNFSLEGPKFPCPFWGTGQAAGTEVCTGSGRVQAAWPGREEGQSSKSAREHLLSAWLGRGWGAGRGQMQPLLLGSSKLVRLEEQGLVHIGTCG